MYVRARAHRHVVKGRVDFQAETLQHPREQIPLFFVRVKQTENCGTVYSGWERGKRRDETRATFAPVHRPRPPQIVKSCLQLSEILIFSDESFSSCLSSLPFSSSRSTRSRSSIIFRQITIFSSKRESRKVYSSHSPFHVTIASTCRNFAGSLKSFRAFNPRELTTVITLVTR